MQVNTDDVLKVFAAFFGAGGGFAFFKPFAGRLFTLWLDRIDARQKAETKRAEAELERERALERIAVTNERTAGVLEQMLEWLKRIDARQDRHESWQTAVAVHLGLPQTASVLPPQPPAAPTLAHRPKLPTDPGAGSGAPPAAPSAPTGAPA